MEIAFLLQNAFISSYEISTVPRSFKNVFCIFLHLFWFSITCKNLKDLRFLCDLFLGQTGLDCVDHRASFFFNPRGSIRVFNLFDG